MKKNNPYQQLSTTDNDPKSLESQPDPPQQKDQQPDSSSPGPEFTLKKPGAFDKPGQHHLSAGSPSPGSAPSGKPAPDGNTIKDPKDWTTGDEPMTGAQRSYLHTLAGEAGEQIPDNMTKAQASEKIEELQHKTGRGLSEQEKGKE